MPSSLTSVLALAVTGALPLTLGCSGGSVTASSSGTEQPSGAQVHVRIVAEQTPVAATDGTSRETPIDQRVGVLGLELLRSETDASPLVVWAGNSPVDAGYNDGDDTLVASVDAAKLTAGSYAFARVPVAYVKFAVAGTYHSGASAVAGQFADTISLSQKTMLDGAERDQGWFSDSFLEGAINVGTVTGEGAGIGQPAVASGIHLDMSSPQGAYVFPAAIDVDPTIGQDVTYTFTFNTYADYHWQDQGVAGYTNGTFDVSYGTWEPVTQLGANSVTLTID